MVNWVEVREALLPILGSIGIAIGLFLTGALIATLIEKWPDIRTGFQFWKSKLYTLEVRMTEQSQAQLVCEECGGDYSPYESTAKNARGFCSTECEVSGLTPPIPRPPKLGQNLYVDNGAYIRAMAYAQNAPFNAQPMMPATYTTGIMNFPLATAYRVYNYEGLLQYTVQGDGTTINATNPGN